jgi:glutamate dehydrogenase
MGPAFVKRVQDDTNADVVTIARAYTIARQICDVGGLYKTIESLDNRLAASAQMTMLFELSRTLRHACYWLIDRYGNKLQIATTVERLKPGMKAVYGRTSNSMSTSAREREANAMARYLQLGVPEALALRMASLLLTRAALDIADLAAEYKRDVADAAKLYSLFNENLSLFLLHVGAEDLDVYGRWQAIARNNLREEFYRIRRIHVSGFLQKRGKKPVDAAANAWLQDKQTDIEQFRAMLHEMKLRGEFDFATLSVAAQEFRKLIAN